MDRAERVPVEVPDYRHGDRTPAEPGFHDAFWAAKKALAAATQEAFAAHGVFAGQNFVLQRLWERDGQTPAELARRLGLSTPTVTATAARLQAAGFLTRSPHPSDRRTYLLTLTQRGWDLRRAIDEDLAGVTEQALGGMDPQMRQCFLEGLLAMREALTARQRKGADH